MLHGMTSSAAQRNTLALAACLVTLGVAGLVSAQTGVSDDRVSLPEGAGSLEGVGDDVSVDPNMGTMSYAIPFDSPSGFDGLSPNLSLGYSSGGGSGPAGIGWSMGLPSIERLTLRGVPLYDADDEFMADGEQLVLVETDGNTQHYRARCEGGFVRYTWHDVGDGDAGWFTAERPDGTICAYGADRDGDLVASARFGDEDLGTFRYLPVECWDGYDHRLEYTWGRYGHMPLIDRIAWVFTDGDAAYEARFTWESRDDHVIDATAGFEQVLQHRLAEVQVNVRGNQRSRYELVYEDTATSGGFSRLASVRTFGVGDAEYPVAPSFGYTAPLGQLCDSDDCVRPYVVDMPHVDGSAELGVNLQSGNATLLDFNGDGLPDLVDTTRTGEPHRIFVNVPSEDGTVAWDGPFDSAVGDQNGHDLSDARVQVLDFNGDGFTDLMSTATGDVLVNRGGGDWDEVQNLFGGGDTLDFAGDFSEGELQTIRFIDYDNDRRIDVIRSAGSGDGNVTTIWRNTGSGFVQDEAIEPIEAGFDSDTLELNDFNGDGLLDAVQVQPTSVRYRLNLGNGRWSAWRTAEGALDFDAQEAEDAELEDMNGDALADLVLVSGDTVRLWINRNGRAFDDEITIRNADVDTSMASIPERLATTSVLFADMNGNGSSDVVWVTQTGAVTVLELFPTRPNLLSRVENGLGLVIDVDYGTSVEHMARDGGPGAWDFRVPFPTLVVDRLDEWDTLTNVHQTVEYSYHNGYYDGVEKTFRGFRDVEEFSIGDESLNDGEVRYTYDVGEASHCRAGRVLALERVDDGRVISRHEDTLELCELADIPTSGLLFDVEFWCTTTTETELREGAAESAWVVNRTTYAYDGYGHRVEEYEHGIVSIGGDTTCGPCELEDGLYGEPCGAGCLGDENLTRTDYVIPGEDTDGTWVLGLPWRERVYPEPDADRYQEVLTWYDGPAFEGLPQGQAINGFVSRVEQRADVDDRYIVAVRAEADAHGNVITQISPLGDVDGDAYIRRHEFSADGLRPITGELLLGDRGDGLDVMRQELRYDPIFDEPSTATELVLYRNGTPIHEASPYRWAYDAFGRSTSIWLPGDAAGAPTYTYEWDLAAPVSRRISTIRLADGGTRTRVECMDGRSQEYQTRQQVGEGDWYVNGFDVFNRGGLHRLEYQPYRATSGDCDLAPPEGGLAMQSRYDAQGREIEVTLPDGSMQRAEFGPRETLVFDENDTDPTSAHFDTPTVRRFDGLGRITAVGRTNDDREVEWFTMQYDATGALARVEDPMGNVRRQYFDLMAQLVRVEDPDRGTISFSYSDEGDIVEMTNGAGETVLREFDAAGRIVREWDADDANGAGYEVLWDTAPDCPEGFCAHGSNLPVGMRFDAFEHEGALWMTYDLRGPMTRMRQTIGSVSLEVGYRYDAIGTLNGVELPGGRDIDFEVDGMGNVIGVPGMIDGVGFNDRGELAEITMANGTVTTLQTDDRMRLVGTTVTGPTGTVLDLGFELDAAGLLLGVDDQSGAEGPSHTAQYAYDALNRLVGATLDDEETLTYAYDAADNILSRVSSLGDASPVHDGDRTIDPNRPHQVLQAGPWSYAYDGAGRMTTRGDQTLEWNVFGRQVGTRGADGAMLSEHAYIDDDTRAMTRSGDQTTYFLGDNIEVVDGVASWTFSHAGSTVARIEYADAAAEIYTDLAPAAVAGDVFTPEGDAMITAGDAWLSWANEAGVIELDAEAVTPMGELLSSAAALGLIGYGDRTSFLHRNHLGSLAVVTDEDGEVVERTTYYPFGLQRSSTTNDPERLGYTSARRDPGTNLLVMGIRSYDPHLGRWTAPDLAFQGIDAGELGRAWEAMGTYVYSLNAPTTYQDDSGAWGVKGWTRASMGMAVLGGVGGAVVGFMVAGPVGAVAGGILGASMGGLFTSVGIVSAVLRDTKAEFEEAYNYGRHVEQFTSDLPSSAAARAWDKAHGDPDAGPDLAAMMAQARPGAAVPAASAARAEAGLAQPRAAEPEAPAGPQGEADHYFGEDPYEDVPDGMGDRLDEVEGADEGVGGGFNLAEEYTEFATSFDGEPDSLDARADDLRSDGDIDYVDEFDIDDDDDLLDGIDTDDGGEGFYDAPEGGDTPGGE